MYLDRVKENLLRGFAIAIDGPSGSGKTTTAKLVAERLGFTHIDTGAMYRAITLAAVREKCNLEDGDSVGEIARSHTIKFKDSEGSAKKVILNGEDVSKEIRSAEVTAKVSLVSSHWQVRNVMASMQRKMAFKGGVVLEGRDIGTVIIPHAQVKIFLTASITARARRRHLEYAEQGINKPLEEIKKDIEERDRFDSCREMSPLKRPVGSIAIDTTNFTIEQQVNKVMEITMKSSSQLAELKIAGADKGEMLIRKTYFRAGQFLIRSFFRFFWGMKVRQLEKLDYNENYIFACNHLSYMDPPLVGSTLPREIYFLAKAELFNNRLFVWLISKYNAIPIKRGLFDKEAMKRVLSILERGKSMMIFPEGTRMKDGKLGRPRHGVGFLAVNSGTPVVPVYVEATNRLVQAFFRKPRLKVIIGHPIRLNDTDTVKWKNSKSYRDYSSMVMEAIDALKDSMLS